MGTSRAQHHLRQVCVYLDMHPLNKPEVFSNAFGPSFNEDGDLVDEKILELVKRAVGSTFGLDSQAERLMAQSCCLSRQKRPAWPKCASPAR